VLQEFSREGSISLQRVTYDDVGVRGSPEAEGICHKEQVQCNAASEPPEDCAMKDDDITKDDAAACESAKERVTVRIEVNTSGQYAQVHLNTADHGNVVAGSVQTAPVAVPNEQRSEMKAAANYVPGRPLLEYEAVSKAQAAWVSSQEYRVPTLLQYGAHHDTRTAWQQRMSAIRCGFASNAVLPWNAIPAQAPLRPCTILLCGRADGFIERMAWCRSIWAAKDAIERKKREEEAAKKAAEAQKQLQARAQAQAQAQAQAVEAQQQAHAAQAAQEQSKSPQKAAAPQQPVSAPPTQHPPQAPQAQSTQQLPPHTAASVQAPQTSAGCASCPFNFLVKCVCVHEVFMHAWN
jgi:hypothetical protein